MEAVVDLTEKMEEWESQQDQTSYHRAQAQSRNLKSKNPPPEKENGRRRGTVSPSSMPMGKHERQT